MPIYSFDLGIIDYTILKNCYQKSIHSIKIPDFLPFIFPSFASFPFIRLYSSISLSTMQLTIFFASLLATMASGRAFVVFEHANFEGAPDYFSYPDCWECCMYISTATSALTF